METQFGSGGLQWYPMNLSTHGPEPVWIARSASIHWCAIPSSSARSRYVRSRPRRLRSPASESVRIVHSAALELDNCGAEAGTYMNSNLSRKSNCANELVPKVPESSTTWSLIGMIPEGSWPRLKSYITVGQSISLVLWCDSRCFG